MGFRNNTPVYQTSPRSSAISMGGAASPNDSPGANQMFNARSLSVPKLSRKQRRLAKQAAKRAPVSSMRPTSTSTAPSVADRSGQSYGFDPIRPGIVSGARSELQGMTEAGLRYGSSPALDAMTTHVPQMRLVGGAFGPGPRSSIANLAQGFGGKGYPTGESATGGAPVTQHGASCPPQGCGSQADILQRRLQGKGYEGTFETVSEAGLGKYIGMESQNVPEEGQGSLTPHEYLRYRDPGSDEWTYLDPWKDQYRQGETGDWSKFGKTPVGSMASAQSASSGGRLGSKAVRSSRAGEGPGGMTPLYLGSGVDEQKLLFKYGTQSASEGAQEGLTMNEQREMTSIVPTAGQPWLSDPNMSKKDRKRAEKLWKQQDKKRVKAQKASTKTKKAGGSRAQVEITDARGRTKMVYEGSAGHREAQAREAMASTTEGVASSTGGVASSGLQTAGSLGDRMASSTGGVASSTGGPTPTGQQDSVLEEALSALGAGTGTSYGGSGSGVTGPGSPWTSGETRQFGFGSNTSRPTAKTSNYGTDSSPAGFRW